MKQFKVVLLTAAIFLLVVLAVVFWRSRTDTSQQFKKNYQSKREEAIVKFVYDGDTILLDNNQKVRLLGIDAPEKGEKCYQEAKDKLFDLVFRKKVALVKSGDDKDKYGRLLRFVYLDGVNINLLLLRQGFVRVYYGFPRSNDFEYLLTLERQAKRAQQGCLWSD